MKPIYKPSGRALEYSPDALACNIYTGCPHRCYWSAFGKECVELCEKYKRNYYIKHDLRELMI